MKSIVLIGFKSCGKSSIGRQLAEKLDWGFIDTDMIIEKIHLSQKVERLFFREIYQKYGKKYFRRLEGQAVQQIVLYQEHVIAAGGGTFIQRRPPQMVHDMADFVYLKTPPDILKERIRHGGIPAFFKGKDFDSTFAQYYQKREPIYEDLADMTFDTEQLNVTEVAEQLFEQWQQRKDD